MAPHTDILRRDPAASIALRLDLERQIRNTRREQTWIIISLLVSGAHFWLGIWAWLYELKEKSGSSAEWGAIISSGAAWIALLLANRNYGRSLRDLGKAVEAFRAK